MNSKKANSLSKQNNVINNPEQIDLDKATLLHLFRQLLAILGVKHI